MFKKKLSYIIGLLILLPLLVYAEEEECLLCDAIIGASIAVCQSFPTCNLILSIFSITFFFIGSIAFCCGSDDYRSSSYESRPSGRSAVAGTAGYMVGRMLVG
tara:strand:+ start:174 stop:482 length:309 start_codon:yes stop_codon:yes gene_type:complete